MPSPSCKSSKTSELAQKTVLGYRIFRCTDCNKRFNERTGASFNNLQVPAGATKRLVAPRVGAVQCCANGGAL